MQTNFTPEALRDPQMARSNEVLRACVHCGFCTATCPTYQVLGDELDSPRGRIYLMKQMLESGRPADAKTVKHIDRCLSCLACMTTCPSGVHYMHLVDHAREYIERTYRRPLPERMLRALLALVLPHPGRFRLALRAAQLTRPVAGFLPGRLRGMVGMAPERLPAASPLDRPQVFPAEGERRKRVALMTGCAQRVLSPEINEATIRLLTRHGCEVVIASGAGCCGALTHHMGKARSSHRFAEANIRAWLRERDGAGLDAVVINASGCGTTVKDYGHMFRAGPLAAEAAAVSAMTRDISEIMIELGLKGAAPQETAPIAAHAPQAARPLLMQAEDGKAQGYEARRAEDAAAMAHAGVEALQMPTAAPVAVDAGHGDNPSAPGFPAALAPAARKADGSEGSAGDAGEGRAADAGAAAAAGEHRGLRVAYHAACSLQHGQQIKTHPKTLLARAGFIVVEPVDAHLCCGSAGTYNLLQPEIAGALKERKVRTIEATKPDVIAAGNIGCIVQIAGGTAIPVVHTAELLDWATGGPKPKALAMAGR